MKVLVKEDAKVLIPNNQHKNFTETNEIIPKETVLNGSEKFIEGLRRGDPFTYRLFVTENNKIIYLNNIKPMREVTMGADGQVSSTKINLAGAESLSRAKLIAIAIGGVAGYYYANKKGKSTRDKAIFTVGGAIAGYLVGYLIDKNKGVVVEQKNN
jgi:hypothetical protein